VSARPTDDSKKTGKALDLLVHLQYGPRWWIGADQPKGPILNIKRGDRAG